MILLHAVENLLLVWPAIFTYGRIKTRHQFLEDTIGPVPLESLAMQNMELLVILAPLFILLSVPVQFGFIWGFNKYGHPWKMFFREFSHQQSSTDTSNTEKGTINKTQFKLDDIELHGNDEVDDSVHVQTNNDIDKTQDIIHGNK